MGKGEIEANELLDKIMQQFGKFQQYVERVELFDNAQQNALFGYMACFMDLLKILLNEANEKEIVGKFAGFLSNLLKKQNGRH